MKLSFIESAPAFSAFAEVMDMAAPGNSGEAGTGAVVISLGATCALSVLVLWPVLVLSPQEASRKAVKRPGIANCVFIDIGLDLVQN